MGGAGAPDDAGRGVQGDGRGRCGFRRKRTPPKELQTWAAWEPLGRRPRGPVGHSDSAPESPAVGRRTGRLTGGRRRRTLAGMTPHPDHFRLLHGPYQAPALEKGDVAHCLFRGAPAVVTNWTSARIPWPRCRLLEGKGGGSGLLVDEELARAVRRESGVALMYWFGVGHGSVTNWRKALGVPPNNEGSSRLRTQLNRELGAAQRGVRWPPERVERQRRAAREAGKKPPANPAAPPRPPEELALPGKLPDREVAARTGRTLKATQQKRLALGIPAPLRPRGRR